MKLVLVVTLLLVQHQQSEAFLSKLGSVGSAMKALSTFFKKTEEAKESPTSTGPGAAEGTLMEQIEFVHTIMANMQNTMKQSSNQLMDKMKPLLKTMCGYVLPQYDQLNISDEMLTAHYKLSPEQVKKYKFLYFDTRRILQEMTEADT